MATIHLHQTTTATPEQFLARQPDGRTSVDAVVIREGKNPKGRARS